MEYRSRSDRLIATYSIIARDAATRLLAALEAAEIAGGDIRGRQSSALLVVAGERMNKPWHGRAHTISSRSQIADRA
jgi:uncharacterized Ntn-hydrolase superfamily protein